MKPANVTACAPPVYVPIMRSWAKIVSFGAVCAALVLATGCQGKIASYGPPKPASVTGAGGGGNGGAGGATTGSGATSGSGASGGSSGSTTSVPVPLNMCECGYEAVFGPKACTDCINAANNAMNGACGTKFSVCNLDPDCTAIITCPANCFKKPVDEQVTCIQACFVPFGDDEAHKLAADYLSCACTTCEASCQSGTQISCQ